MRLIGPNEEALGIVSIDEALDAARRAELDLVEIAATASPPVCRIMDFGKYQYQQSKKRNEAKKKQKQIQIKEIKFRPGTEEADYQVKVRKVREFLEEGNKVKLSLRYRGREITHQEIGMGLMRRVEKDLLEQGVVEQQPKLEGKQMMMVLAPKRK